MNWTLLLMVAVGGSVGAPARFLVDRAVAVRFESDLPLGTILINTTGSAMLGVLSGLAVDGGFPVLLATLLGVGFCGAYTTFSTLVYELVALTEDGRLLEAAGSLLISLAAGLAAAGGGFAIARAI